MSSNKPNILLITLDQWRAECIGYLGHPVVKTPHIDEFCKEAVVFKNHYTCSAPCGPSRATLLTGMYPHNHRSVRNGTPLNATLTNVAKEMRKSGYDPTLFGYTDTTPDPRFTDHNDPAYKMFEGIMPGFSLGANLPTHSRLWLNWLRKKGHEVTELGYGNYEPDKNYPIPEGRHETYAPTTFPASASETAWMTEQVLDHLRYPEEDPFFLHTTYLRPHPPFIATPEYMDMYHPDDMTSATGGDVESEKAKHPYNAYKLERIRKEDYCSVGEGLAADWDDAGIRQIRANYFALISEADTNLGELFAEMKANGQWDNTMIILTTDHADQLGDHHLFGKMGYYDQAFHIPLMIKPPKSLSIETGRIVEAFTESIDIMPTILETVGQDVPYQCDGKSLLPWLNGGSAENWRDHVSWLYDFRSPKSKSAEDTLGLESKTCNVQVIRDHRYKYVHFSGLPCLFFDMEADPTECNNLIDSPDHQALVAKYAQKMISWRMAHEYNAITDYLGHPDGLVDGRKM